MECARVLAEVTNPAIQFVIYDLLKRNFCQEAVPSALEAFFAGAVAKSCATCTTYPQHFGCTSFCKPFEPRTRQRVHRHAKGADASIVHCLLEVIVSNGASLSIQRSLNVRTLSLLWGVGR